MEPSAPLGLPAFLPPGAVAPRAPRRSLAWNAHTASPRACAVEPRITPRKLHAAPAAAAAAALRDAHRTEAAALRSDLIARVAAAAAVAAQEAAVDELARAVDTAADARTQALAARARRASIGDEAVRVRDEKAKEVALEKMRAERAERRVAFLDNRLKEIAASGAPAVQPVKGKVPVRPVESPVDARMLLGGLFLYTGMGRGESGVFHAELGQFLNAVAEVGSVGVVEAYASLWRAAAAPGSKGWCGEILHAVITRGDKELLREAQVSPDIMRAFMVDLRALHRLYATPPDEVASWVGSAGGMLDGGAMMSMPKTRTPSGGVDQQEETTRIMSLLSKADDWGDEEVAQEVLAYITEGPSQAASIADKYYGMRWYPDGKLEGVLSARDVSDMPNYHFVGVEDLRERMAQQCEFLLNGLPTSNVLLYGPPGSGKSSCAMSMLKDFGERGLRVIEVSKDTLACLPQIYEAIAGLPHKFICFIDDLSFDESETEAMRLAKAALEGSLRVNPPNVFVLCTSNRRFPVGSRLTDASEEKLAFTMRFGVILAFPRMTRDTYMKVVRTLCRERGVIMDPEEMQELALAWALGQDGNSNSLSGRTARQFADHVSSVQALRGLGQDPAYLASANNVNANGVPANSTWATEGAGHTSGWTAH